ncbi:MAG: type II toxin-antitoxin system VapC family toxin [Anaerolineales bacterium]|nr:type II toxin-antitoxin system VapC family toxin [Anaerolineales bacterium]
MSVILLDTNIISFIIKGDTRIHLYAAELNGKQHALSFMTVAELYQWAGIRNWGARRLSDFEKMLESYAVLPADRRMPALWGQIKTTSYKSGRSISTADAWIATTALYYQLPLVTHNPKDFDFIPNLTIVTFA